MFDRSIGESETSGTGECKSGQTKEKHTSGDQELCYCDSDIRSTHSRVAARVRAFFCRWLQCTKSGNEEEGNINVRYSLDARFACRWKRKLSLVSPPPPPRARPEHRRTSSGAVFPRREQSKPINKFEQTSCFHFNLIEKDRCDYVWTIIFIFIDFGLICDWFLRSLRVRGGRWSRGHFSSGLRIGRGGRSGADRACRMRRFDHRHPRASRVSKSANEK